MIKERRVDRNPEMHRLSGLNQRHRVGLPIYVHVPKTGGRYFKQVLFHKGIQIRYMGHAPLRYLDRSRMEEGTFSFAMVRCPYERFLSACQMQNIHSSEDLEKVSEELANGTGVDYISDFNLLRVEHFLSQYKFVTDYDDETVLVDYIGRYSNIPEYLQELKKRGLDVVDEFVIKKNVEANWREIFTDRTIENLNKVYKKDFEFFNFEMVKT